MTKISKEEVAKVAELARIELTNNESEAVTEKLSSVLSFVDILQSVDTEGIEPTSQVTGLTDVWRVDLVVDCRVSPQELLANAPMLQDGYIKVKKVL